MLFNHFYIPFSLSELKQKGSGTKDNVKSLFLEIQTSSMLTNGRIETWPMMKGSVMFKTLFWARFSPPLLPLLKSSSTSLISQMLFPIPWKTIRLSLFPLLKLFNSTNNVPHTETFNCYFSLFAFSEVWISLTSTSRRKEKWPIRQFLTFNTSLRGKFASPS